MGQELGRTVVRRIFWGCMVVVLDITIDGFDVLVDPVGYLMIAGAAGQLIVSDRAFRVVQNCGHILAVFSVAGIIRSMRAAAATGGGVNGDSGGWNWSQRGLADISTAEGFSFTSTLDLIGTAVGCCLIWFLLTGIARIAEADDLAPRAERALWARNWLTATLGVSELAAWLLLVMETAEPANWLILVAGLSVALLGLATLKVLWDASNELLFLSPTTPARAKVPPMVAASLGVVAALAGLASIVWSGQAEIFDPYDPVHLASERQPAGRSQPDHLEIDVVEPVGAGEIGAVGLDGIGFSEPYDNPSSCQALSGLTAISLTSGDPLWSQDIPRQEAGRLMTLGNNVLVLDSRIGYLLPSVAALNATNGELEWQHFLDASSARFFGHGQDSVAVSFGEPDHYHNADVIVLDGHGHELDRFDDKLTYGGHLDDNLPPGYEIWSVPDILHTYYNGMDAPVEFQTNIFAPPADRSNRQALLEWHSDRRLTYLDTTTGNIERGDPLPAIGLYNRLGNRHSPGNMLQHNEHLTMVLFGSDQGPNSKAVAFDPQSGDRLWEKEHLRSAALAGDLVLFDKRNEHAPHQLVTRTLHLADGRDPDTIIWTIDLSVNQAGGNGYLGTLGEGQDQLVFLVEDGDEQTDFMFVPTVNSMGSIPPALRAGGRLGGGPGPLSHIDDTVVVAADRTEVLWRRAGHDTQRIDLVEQGHGPSEIRALTVAGDTLLVEHDRLAHCGDTRHMGKEALVVGPETATYNLPEVGVDNSCDPPSTALTAVDSETGQQLWTASIPAQPGGLQPFGDGAVLVADTRSGGHGPSLSLLDVTTGGVRWQRSFNSDTLTLVAVDNTSPNTTTDTASYGGPTAMVVTEIRPRIGRNTYGLPANLGIIVDLDGTIVHDFPIVHDQWSHSSMVVPGYENLSSAPYGRHVASPVHSNQQGVAVYHGPVIVVDSKHVRLTLPPGALYNQEWTGLGNDTSPGVPVQVGEGVVMVLLKSHLGPNSRLKVFDSSTGDLLWQEDHLRSAAIAGEYILYDKRNEKPSDARFTRQVFLVDADDVDNNVWTARLSINDAGGNGYIGDVDWGQPTAPVSGMVFVTQSDDNPPGFQILDLNGDTPLPADLFAGGSVGGGPSPLGFVSNELGAEIMIAADGNAVLWRQPGGETQRVTLDGVDPIASLAFTDGVILAEQRTEITFC